MRSVPPAGMASRALTARLSSTWLRCVGSMRTHQPVAVRLGPSETASPRWGRRSFVVSSITAATESRAGFEGALRVSVSSCLTRLLPRSTATCMSWRSWRRVASPREEICSMHERTTVRMLPRSCAMPPASRPTRPSSAPDAARPPPRGARPAAVRARSRLAPSASASRSHPAAHRRQSRRQGRSRRPASRTRPEGSPPASRRARGAAS